MTAELQTIFTIGVYGSTEDAFFGILVDKEICGVRVTEGSPQVLVTFAWNSIEALNNRA